MRKFLLPLSVKKPQRNVKRLPRPRTTMKTKKRGSSSIKVVNAMVNLVQAYDQAKEAGVFKRLTLDEVLATPRHIFGTEVG